MTWNPGDGSSWTIIFVFFCVDYSDPISLLGRRRLGADRQWGGHQYRAVQRTGFRGGQHGLKPVVCSIRQGSRDRCDGDQEPGHHRRMVFEHGERNGVKEMKEMGSKKWGQRQFLHGNKSTLTPFPPYFRWPHFR